MIYYFNGSISLNETSNNTTPEKAETLYVVPVGVIVLLSVFYGTISVVAIIGNALVIWIVATSRRMQNVTNYFIANLALADVIIALFAIPFQFQAAILQRWNLPEFMCPFCPFIQCLSVNVSIFTLTAISIDRHRAIIFPLSARLTKLSAQLQLAGIWIFALGFAIPMAVAYKVHYELENGSEKPVCRYRETMEERPIQVYRLILFFIQYLVPVTVISVVYTRMGLCLWGSRAPGNAQCIRDSNIMKNKKKVIKMLVIVVTTFSVCWLPLQLYNALQNIYLEINNYRYINIIWFCFDWLAMSNSCYNPFIYGMYNEKFKREFQLRRPWKPCWRGTNLDKNSGRTMSTHNWSRSSGHDSSFNQNHQYRCAKIVHYKSAATQEFCL